MALVSIISSFRIVKRSRQKAALPAAADNFCEFAQSTKSASIKYKLVTGHCFPTSEVTQTLYQCSEVNIIG